MPMTQLRPGLTRSDTELLERLAALGDARDAAEILEIPYRQLAYILFANRAAYPYRIFSIAKKSGGVRKISAPHPSIAILQSKLNRILSLVYQPKACVHGFTRNRSIVTNAEKHLRQRWVLNVDLEDFFPTITFPRVYGVLQAKPYELPQAVATIFANVCCTEDGVLPQGGVTSPLISNLVAFDLDKRMMRLARSHHCMYSRYADDMTISTREKDFPLEIANPEFGYSGSALQMGPDLIGAITAGGFTINSGKSRLQFWDSRQTVTGVVVNRRPNLPRTYVRQVRAMIDSWRRDGVIAATAKHNTSFRSDGSITDLRDVIRGKLNYLRMVRREDDRLFRRYWNEARDADPVTFPALPHDEVQDLLDEIDAAETKLNRGEKTTTVAAQAGNALEEHLNRLCARHLVQITSARPTLSTFNMALKGAGIFDLATFRWVESLGDIRNKQHAWLPDPTPQEASRLISGCRDVVKVMK